MSNYPSNVLPKVLAKILFDRCRFIVTILSGIWFLNDPSLLLGIWTTLLNLSNHWILSSIDLSSTFRSRNILSKRLKVDALENRLRLLLVCKEILMGLMIRHIWELSLDVILEMVGHLLNGKWMYWLLSTDQYKLFNWSSIML